MHCSKVACTLVWFRARIAINRAGRIEREDKHLFGEMCCLVRHAPKDQITCTEVIGRTRCPRRVHLSAEDRVRVRQLRELCRLSRGYAMRSAPGRLLARLKDRVDEGLSVVSRRPANQLCIGCPSAQGCEKYNRERSKYRIHGEGFCIGVLRRTRRATSGKFRCPSSSSK
jgi:hypothetical protein